MFQVLRPTLRLVLSLSALAVSAGAQQTGSMNYFQAHGAEITFGGTGVFTRSLTTNPQPVFANVPLRAGTYPTSVSNQQQFTTGLAGAVLSLQFHPVAWAGLELNYGYNHNQERFTFNYGNAPGTQGVSVNTDVHEFTAAYELHPKHIPLQPFVNIGGGSLDFAPNQGSNQWRGAGLVETGLDLPTHNPHFGFRVEGRSLFYRAPNFKTAAISTRSWRATVEPEFGTFIRF